MNGILQQKEAVEQFKREYQMMAMCQFTPEKSAAAQLENLVLEECEL